MSDVKETVDGKKKKFKMGDPLKSPGNFGAFGGMFILQGIISLIWGVTAQGFNIDFESATLDRVTAVSVLDTANTAVCLYGIACIIGGILMIGIENIIETLKPTGRKPTIKGWISSIFGAAFVSAIIMLPFFIIFNIIKH
jgi:hypothetical protein